MRAALILALAMRDVGSLLLAQSRDAAATHLARTAAAEDRAGAGIHADLAGRRAGHTRGFPRQGGRRDLHLHHVHRLPARC